MAFPDEAATLVLGNAGERRQTESPELGNLGYIEFFGEEYQLNCPFCGDRRGRMRINYTYDPAVLPGRWHCYNEKCNKKPECRAQLANRLQAVWTRAKQMAGSTSAPPAPPTARSESGPPPNVVAE